MRCCGCRPDDPVLRDMLAAARAAEGREIAWGAIGPFLLTEIAEAHGARRRGLGAGALLPGRA